MQHVFVTIAPFFLVIGLGFFLTKINLVDAKWTEAFNLFALRVGFPALIFSALVKTHISFNLHGALVLFNSAYLLFCFLFAFVVSYVFKLSNKLKYTFLIIFPFGNIAYLGMPVLSEIYGVQKQTELSLLVGVYLFWMFTLGIFMLERSKNKEASFFKVLTRLYKNPLLLAVIVGIIISFIEMPTENVLFKSVELLSKAATPVVLFSIGIFVSQIKFGTIAEWRMVGIYAFIKLIILPLLFFAVLKAIYTFGNIVELSVVEASMPLALTPYALSQEYNLDSPFIARSILLTTILSIITIPFWVIFVQ